MIRRIFIGWDVREQDAYDVCAHSLRRHSSVALHITPLKHRPLRKSGLFTRSWSIEADGQFRDVRDDKPFSTEFAFTRFLIPELCRQEEIDGWVLFCDCDFLFRADVNKLFDECDNNKALMCVQHNYAPPEGVKMDDMRQESYRRKNWSSLMLFNLNHYGNTHLTAHEVNYQPGWWLHGLKWLEDDEIGALPEAWNWLAGWSSKDIEPKAIHYTMGGPWMEGHENCVKAAEWVAEYEMMRGK